MKQKRTQCHFCRVFLFVFFLFTTNGESRLMSCHRRCATVAFVHFFVELCVIFLLRSSIFESSISGPSSGFDSFNLFTWDSFTHCSHHCMCESHKHSTTFFFSCNALVYRYRRATLVSCRR